MIDIDHFRLHVVRATLIYMHMWSASAEELLVGTAVTESGLRYLRQFNDGPARGLYQIEPATHDDITDRYLARHSDIRKRLYTLLAPIPSRIDQLVTNLAYATAIARVKYWMQSEPLPEANDYRGLAQYYKKYYNTRSGAAVLEKTIDVFKRVVENRLDR